MRYDNIQMLDETLSNFRNGEYRKNGKTIKTKLSMEQAKECFVYLPEEVRDIMNRKDFEHVHVIGRIGFRCRNMDSFAMAQESSMYSSLFAGKKQKNVLLIPIIQ